MTDRVAPLFHRRSAQVGLFAAVWATMVVIRFVVFASDGAPPTIDAGNWLAFGDGLLGDDSRSSDIVYPPVVPVLTKVSVALFGLTAGVSLMASLAATAPAVGVFVTLSSLGMGRARLFPSMVLLGVGSVGEAASWGGFPQLMGMGLLPVGVLAMQRLLADPNRGTALRAGLAAMAMLAVSHFVAAVLVVAALVLIAMRLIEGRSLSVIAPIARHAWLVVLPCIWLLPIYLELVDAVFIHPNDFADLDNLTWGNFIDRLEGIYADAPVLWRLLIPLTVVTPFLSWSVGRSTLVPMQRALFISVAVLLAVSQESRYFYLLPTLAMLSVALWIREASKRIEERPPHLVSRHRAVLAAIVTLALIAQMWAGTRQLDDQRYFYTAMSPPLVDAIELAGDIAGHDGTLAVPSVRNAPIGWWVEAIVDGPVLYGSALRWLNFDDEVARAKVANAVFTPDFPDEDTSDRLLDAGVDVLVLPRTWEWFDDDAVARWLSTTGHRLALTNGDALVIELSDDLSSG